MSASNKFFIGLAASLLVGWVFHGPLGYGQRLIERLESQARGVVNAQNVPGITVRLQRDPLSRAAVLSGTATRFQREGLGRQPGLKEMVAASEGIGSVRWDDEGAEGGQ